MMLNDSPVTRLSIPVSVFWNMVGYLSGRYEELEFVRVACQFGLFFVSRIGICMGTHSSSSSSIAPSIASGAVLQLLAPRSLIRRFLSAWYRR